MQPVAALSPWPRWVLPETIAEFYRLQRDCLFEGDSDGLKRPSLIPMYAWWAAVATQSDREDREKNDRERRETNRALGPYRDRFLGLAPE